MDISILDHSRGESVDPGGDNVNNQGFNLGSKIRESTMILSYEGT